MNENTPDTDATWPCCGHAAYYHGPEAPGCVECRCMRVTDWEGKR